MPENSATPDYGLSQKQASQILGCSTKTIERYLNKGKLAEFGNFARRKVRASSVAEIAGGREANSLMFHGQPIGAIRMDGLLYLAFADVTEILPLPPSKGSPPKYVPAWTVIQRITTDAEPTLTALQFGIWINYVEIHKLAPEQIAPANLEKE